MSHIIDYCEAIRRGEEYLPRLLRAMDEARASDDELRIEESDANRERQAKAYQALADTVSEFDQSKMAIVPRQVRNEYLNILEPIAKGEDPDYYLDLSSVPILGPKGEEIGRKGPAQRFIDFIEATCLVPEGEKAGNPIRFEPFQKAYAEALLGIKDRLTGRRVCNESAFTVARKNGKTALLSTLGLYGTLDTPGAKVYCAATSKEQASQVYDAAVYYVDHNPVLTANFRHRVFPRTETWIGNSHFRVLPNETKRQDGLKVSLGIIDEIHALPRKIYDLLNQATTAFPEPLIVMIGSAGFLAESLYKDKTELAEKIAAGAIANPHFLGLNYSQEGDKRIVLDYEPPVPKEDHEAKARRELRNAARRIQWRKSNPGLGTIKDEAQMERVVITALQDPNGLPEVLTKEFNIVTAESAKLLLTPEEIVSQSTRTVISDEELNRILDGCPGVIGGLDLSLDNDLSAFISLVFDREWNQGEGRIVALCQVWASREFIEQQETGGDMRRNTSADVPWRAWIERGFVRIGGEHYIDPSVIVSYTDEMRGKWGWTYKFIFYDQYAAEGFATGLEARGYARNKQLFKAYQQDRWTTRPMKLCKALLKQHALWLQNNPVLLWALSNVEYVESDEGFIKPVKKSNAKGNKIDPASALFDALKGYELNYTRFMPNGLGMRDFLEADEKKGEADGAV